jgi:SAM-dependent methyltransferase
MGQNTKIQLRKFVEQILISALGLHVSDFEIFDCTKNETPFYLSTIPLTHEYLIALNCNNSGDEKNKLLKFLKKEIFVLQHKTVTYLCWFEGNELSQEFFPVKENFSVTESNEISFEVLKNETHLPSWLDNLLFNKLGAIYAPNFERYDSNLDLSMDEIKVYLGTYFPRSYAESFCIFDNIFEKKRFKNEIKKQELNILDIGCGTGGDLIGLLVIINKYSLATQCVNIYTIDGNFEALNILYRIVDEYSVRCSFKINLKIFPQTINRINDINLFDNDVLFDFILSFKMVCEIISKGNGENDNSYYELTKKCLPKLSDTGLFVILDVTTKQDHIGTYNPILMNSQIRNLLREETNKYKTLIPLSCNRFELECNEFCFTQRVFKISHKQRSDNFSKVTYRIIGRYEFVNKIVDLTDDYKYLIMPERICTETFNGFCSKTQKGKIIDSYNIKN